MMEGMPQSKPIQKILVLITVIVFALAGWLVGHILRFSIPEFWHPPIEEITPQIQNGFEFEGIRREVVLAGVGIFTSGGSVTPGEFVFESCVGNTNYAVPHKINLFYKKI